MTSLRTLLPCAAALLLGSGCRRAPSVDLLGSFFPIWMFCIFGGILGTVAVRALLVRLRLDTELRPAAILYPCLASSIACTIWLIFFRN